MSQEQGKWQKVMLRLGAMRRIGSVRVDRHQMGARGPLARREPLFCVLYPAD